MLGLLVSLVILALSACGGEEQQQESKPRPLPENGKALRAGEYRSQEFKPSLSFRVGRAGQAHLCGHLASWASLGEITRI